MKITDLAIKYRKPSLVLTALISDGLTIDGIGTWILATVIVWLTTMIAGVVLPRLFLDDSDRTS